MLSKAPHSQMQGVSEDDKKTVAAYLGGRKIGVAEIADAKKMPNQCTADPPMGDIAGGPTWNGWGVDPATNARFQPASAAGLSAAQVPSLKLKWAFGLPLAEEAHSQPTIVGGRVFLGSDAGTVYSLDAATGRSHARGAQHCCGKRAGVDQVRRVLRGPKSGHVRARRGERETALENQG